MPMTQDEYLKDRLDDQINWYSRKSQRNQKYFKVLRVIEVVFASTIPVLVTQIAPETSLLKIIVGSMAVCVAVASGLVSLYKFQENWIEYRTTAETLKHEKFLFLTKSSPYDGEGSFHALVQCVESLLSKENATWSRILRDKSKEKPYG